MHLMVWEYKKNKTKKHYRKADEIDPEKERYLFTLEFK